MSIHPSLLLLLGFGLSGLGLVVVAWCRCPACPVRARWGSRLFLATLMVLGLVSLLAAWQPQRLVSYLGLSVAALIVLVLWEGPGERRREPRSIM